MVKFSPFTEWAESTKKMKEIGARGGYNINWRLVEDQINWYIGILVYWYVAINVMGILLVYWWKIKQMEY
jgi:hypothetical protein